MSRSRDVGAPIRATTSCSQPTTEWRRLPCPMTCSHGSRLLMTSNPGRNYSWRAGPDGALFLEIHTGAPALMA
jgi:hypothetical protein